jgi:hypothetical protein
MAELIDIVPPIEPQPIAGALEFSWLLILMVLVILFVAWRWFRQSRAWQVWQALTVWQKQGPTASLWQLVGILQDWLNVIASLPQAKQEMSKQQLKLIGHFASQRDKLSQEQQNQLANSIKMIRQTYWRLVFAVYWQGVKQPLSVSYQFIKQRLKRQQSAESKNER